MIFLSSLAEKFVGKSFEIDCVDIEIHGFRDNQPPLFKGPGIIKGDQAGRLTYKIYNQIPINKKIFDYLRSIKEENDPQITNIRFSAKSYDGIEWDGGWSIPSVGIPTGSNMLIHGEFDQLSTRVKKIEGSKTLNTTELVYADQFDLPFSGNVKIKKFHGEKIISTSSWNDHHEISFDDSLIIFRQALDKTRTYITATHKEKFSPPYVENWITEALIFITARVLYPRMIIRHFEADSLVFLRATPRDTKSSMPPPLGREIETRDSLWEIFCVYLSKCKSAQQFELLEITTGFCELCLASKGTLQGFLISLSIFIEFCVSQIFSCLNNKSLDADEYKKKVDALIMHVNNWKEDKIILNRAKGLLSMLNTPSLSNRLDMLVEQGVITRIHKEKWQEARPYLAHGNLIDFKEEERFWNIRNHLIPMVYRLIFKIVGYKGMVMDFDGEIFRYVAFDWNDNSNQNI